MGFLIYLYLKCLEFLVIHICVQEPLIYSCVFFYSLCLLQAPRKHKNAENGTVDAESLTKSKECNGAPLLSESVLQDVRGDLQLHLCLSALFTIPVMLSAPSLLHWLRNLRYSQVHSYHWSVLTVLLQLHLTVLTVKWHELNVLTELNIQKKHKAMRFMPGIAGFIFVILFQEVLVLQLPICI